MKFKSVINITGITCIVTFLSIGTSIGQITANNSRPNILFIISDDQGYPHASAYGCQFVRTPVFDKIAKEGLLFTNFFVSAPQCSPSRASILTGRHIWQNGPAGTHWSSFSSGLITYTDILEEHGYAVGYTGKGWAPGNWIAGGRKNNPAGTKYVDTKDALPYANGRPASGISEENYAGSFEMFLNQKEKDQPFCFWMGGWEPHRPYEKGSGLKRGGKLSSVKLPSYLPDNDVIKSDFLDYAVEIEWFDTQVGKALEILEKKGLLRNTLIIFTSDNGMPFPRAKAYSFDDGTHVPLAIMWKGRIKNAGRIVDHLISGIDLFPTFLEVANLKNEISPIEGKSLLDIFEDDNSETTGQSRDYIFWGRERHGSARWENLGYPQRAIRSDQYLYIRNFSPDRFPAGAPQEIVDDKLVYAYGDIDPSPSKDFMIQHQEDLFKLAFEKFPAEMLYNVRNDPFCMNNLANDLDYQNIKDTLSTLLKQKLEETMDPRVGKFPDVWESYRRYGPMHQFPRPGWADRVLKKSIIRNISQQ